jgi:hypothetical protein
LYEWQPVKLLGFSTSVGLLIAVAVADYLTGYELSLNVFYLGPIALAAWVVGRRAGWCIALVSGIVCVVVDFKGGHPYSQEFYRYWNAGMLIGGYVIVATLVAWLRHSLDVSKRLVAEKEAALRQLQDAMTELQSLEGTFQTVCAWTGKIRDGDEWISLEQYLERHLKIALTHGISPEGKKLFWERHSAGKGLPPKP